MADSVLIRVPAVTEERRKDLAKVAKKFGEDAKVSVRNARQESLKDIKKAKKLFKEACNGGHQDSCKLI